MVLRQGHRPNLAARGEAHQRELGAGEELLNHHPALAEACIEQHIAQRLVGLLSTLGHHYALACGQTVVFEHNGQRVSRHIGCGLVVLLEDTIVGGRYGVLLHNALGKLLARLHACCCLGRAKDEQSRLAEGIDNTHRQHRLGAYHGEVNLLPQSKGLQRLNIGILDGHTLRLLGDACITGCAEYLLHLRRATQRIDYGVASATTTYYQYLFSHIFVQFSLVILIKLLHIRYIILILVLF